MAAFEDCLQFATQTCPLYSEKGIVLKEKQVETLRALYDGKDCVSVLPTGYGKSVIFQLLPWFIQRKFNHSHPKTVLVISPLNSLMHDQVLGLRNKGVAACVVNITGTHGMTYNLKEDIDDEVDAADEACALQSDVPFDKIERGDFVLIYAHPETFIKTKFSKLIRSKSFQRKVCAIVIDEVHMVSEWGDDFRPAFGKLGELVCIFENAIHLALTATATAKSVENLSKVLNFDRPVVITLNVDRPNIYIEVRKRLPNIRKFDKLNNIITPIADELREKRDVFPVTIMYVESLESLGYFFQFLTHNLSDISYNGDAVPQNRIFAQFHKDYPASMKQVIIEELVKPNPKVRLVLATMALGMGVNAPSVERVIHCRPPTTMEAYLQEMGRAGRLGQSAQAILFYNNSDIARNRKGLSEDMRKFCTHAGCYRRNLVNYFGFDSVLFDGDKNNCCSNCRSTENQ
ncbi:LOW QUALITY PROTEIN: ATP-dependent DNA helicase Q-like 3 [Pecten maximus]|uniref:LOW QUALITY PROTEIN: ATP-dependent DNA helicase Q-like 3 n=1 Tax=Pecten maximus TaxID=6579 RepID=UPI001458AF56|nr:LOW QUALITY PROTEIN: ATP-dependent DNA helicase Q-like 3 [Pecten maximus]